MRLGRRLLALSLNVLLIQLAWVGSRGECASAEADPLHRGPAQMAAMHAMPAAAASSIADRSASHAGCEGEMLGASCGLMAACSSASMLNAGAIAAFTPAAAAPRHARDVTRVSLAAPQPLPPPPRA
jgi:hypothetical protein